ncbi:YraN family protein [Clostridium fallax]|uniref:UPF0102 protein SAMN05443638_10641 n=1 Tax=Clostridium fallax TaxID=1533 RepID=A0A1M4UWY6_9CLOT|nr:YraN family protein [Clostridium fallax]SHE61251.1 putative endonuclease [Clostridium fallax]SQB06799.1 endonuclease [Clostridium fallax]
MKKGNKVLGNIGEDLASAYLKKNGYNILERNYRFHKNEIDIIALKDDILIFLEIKSRYSLNFGYGEESITCNKQKQIIKASKGYIMENKIYNKFIRFDTLSINFTKNLQDPDFNLIEDAFRL